MSRTRRKTHTRIAPERVTTELRAAAPRVIARIASAIQVDVRDYAGPIRGERRKLIERAVAAGLHELVGRVSGKARPDADVIEMFRGLGRAEATDGESLEALRAASGIATREVWVELHRISLAQGLPTPALGRLGDALFEEMSHLLEEVQFGYQAALDEMGADLKGARVSLARALLRGDPPAELRGLAAAAQWSLPDTVIVASARPPAGGPDAEFETSSRMLLLAEGTEVLIVCDARSVDEALTANRAVLGEGPVVVSLPVAVSDGDDAARWVRLAWELLDRGLIERQDVIDCADHAMLLWLHAEPALTEALAEQLMGPFAGLTPHRRTTLAHTLLLRLDRRSSAPAIAHQLGLHPQTVRHRLRQLDTMFGQQLHDPETALPMLLVLKTTPGMVDTSGAGSRRSHATRAPRSEER